MEQRAISDTPADRNQVILGDGGSGYASLVTQNQDGLNTISVLVENVTCALCIQKIESALRRSENVQTAHLNFGARRLTIEWHGPVSQIDAYIKTIENLGYGVKPYDPDTVDESIKAEGRFLLLCLGVAGFAMGNIMLLSVGVWSADGDAMSEATRSLFHWVSAAIALPTILFSGRPFFRSALSVLTKGHTNMDVPISLAILLAGGMSLHEVMQHNQHVYFDSAVMLIFFLLIGRYLDFHARAHARSSAHDLLQSFQGFATVVEGAKTKSLPIKHMEEGMVVRVAAGEKFPADGVLINGQSSVDTSLVTGETLPKDLRKGALVFAGTLNLSAPVDVKVTKSADNSLLSDIARLMDKATQSQAAYVRIADRAARHYTPVVHATALLAFLGWVFLGGVVWQEAIMIAVTVLIITCPCALGLAVPVVQVLATNKLMKNGIFVKSGDALERCASIDTALFDKTGTLTMGRLELVGDYDQEKLRAAASLASHSNHPLSKAISDAFEGELLKVENIKEVEGFGVEGEYKGTIIQLGSRKWCGDSTSVSSDHIELWLSRDGKKTCFIFEDNAREDSKNVLQNLNNSGIKTIMLTGDRQAVADKVAISLEMDEVYADKTPPEKYEFLETLQSEGHRVMMVGDGMNDAPTLAKADISIAPGTAIDIAQNAADVVFMGDQLTPVYKTFQIAKRTQRLIKQNFALAVIYNVFAIPLAVMGFVTPLVAALAMSGSSIIVIANSFRLEFKS